MKKILFITGTRADYGKIKSLMRTLEDNDFGVYVYVCGMHLLQKYGSTYNEVLKDNFKNVHVAKDLEISDNMSINLGRLILNLTNFINKNNFDMIVVHGDRVDALGGAIVGALNNVRVAHIEGGELSGTIDDSMRHAISKLSHFHFVCNLEAKNRLIQMGESKDRIFIIGSPDIDFMLSKSLPSLDNAKKKYGIDFPSYSILMFHPVTTDSYSFKEYSKNLVDAIIESNKNYIVIYPNNDLGSEFIVNEYSRLKDKSNIKIFPSIRFEYFLTFLKNCEFMIGNSSAGVRETCVYGIPSIDIGTRQFSRYDSNKLKNIIHVDYSKEAILAAINESNKFRFKCFEFGKGNASYKFLNILKDERIWDKDLQKQFIDME